MKYDVQGCHEIGNSSQGRSLKKLRQYKGHARTEKLKQRLQRQEPKPRQAWQTPQPWPLPWQYSPAGQSPPARQSWEDVRPLWQE